MNNQTYSHEIKKDNEFYKLNTLLTNNKGDFLNFGVNENSCKFQGFSITNPKTFEVFKVIESIRPKGLETSEVLYNGYSIKKRYASSFETKVDFVIDEINHNDQTFGEKGDLHYNSKGLVEEKVEIEPDENQSQDEIYLGPTGGLVYEINKFDGEVEIELDCRKSTDFNEWGREYDVNVENGIIIVTYNKKENEKTSYTLYVAIKAMNFAYDLKKEFKKKTYKYSKKRNSSYEWYTYHLLNVKVNESKKIYFGAGFTKEEAIEQIKLLEFHKEELEGFDKEITKDFVKNQEFKIPLSQRTDVAYKLSTLALYKFLKKDTTPQGFVAGFPWFNQIWSRDELYTIRAFINLREYNTVKKTLFEYLNLIDNETGMIPILKSDKNSNKSFDALFILGKRFEDLIFQLVEHNELDKNLKKEELEIVYEKLTTAYSNVIKTSWDRKEELLKTSYAQSWMDTIETNFPLDSQVQLLNFTSFLGILSEMLQKENTEHYLDIEHGLRDKIREQYFNKYKLVQEPKTEKITSNVFLAYYFYPDLCTNNEWEKIFDKAIYELQTPWGGIASLSKHDKEFKDEYTGETNESYHRGDSWFWINNIAALCLHNLNEKKYRKNIVNLMQSSMKDLFEMGTIGFSSEVSSFKEQRSEGCPAQLWSSSTFIELIDKINQKKY